MEWNADVEWSSYHPFRGIYPKSPIKRYPRRPKIGCQTQKRSLMRKVNKSRGIKNLPRCHDVMQTFFKRFSAAGISRIQTSNSRWRRIAWSVIVLLNAIVMTYMTYKVVKEYFEYKKTVETAVRLFYNCIRVMLSSMDFPAITICSPVTLLKSKARTAGLHHLVRLEDFLTSVNRYGYSKEDRAKCNLNPACAWSWFEDKCLCQPNPCQSEFCAAGYPLCLCSPLLCQYYNETCFQVRNVEDGTNEACYCPNKTYTADRAPRENEPSTSDYSVLDSPEDDEVRDLISIIRESETDDLSDVKWAYQPNIHDLANFGTSFDNLILGCSFQKKKCDKRNFTVLYTPNNGKCYTFNYAGEGSKQSRPVETRRFGWTSGLQLDLQIREDEVLNLLTKDIGAIVAVHNPDELPFVSEYGLILRPGDAASLRVEKGQINRLGYPWGQCLSSGAHLPFKYTDQPYSQLGCQRYCQNYYINQKCNCKRRSLMPPTVTRPKEQNSSTICNFHVISQRTCSEEVIEAIENETIRCNCFQACKENVFYTSLTAGKLNKRYFQLVKSIKTLRKDEGGNLLTTYASNSSNVLSLRVYYGTLTLQNVTERAAYSWETLIANIGGNLGFFMGLTLITFLELAELICDLFLSALKVK